MVERTGRLPAMGPAAGGPFCAAWWPTGAGELLVLLRPYSLHSDGDLYFAGLGAPEAGMGRRHPRPQCTRLS